MATLRCGNCDYPILEVGDRDIELIHDQTAEAGAGWMQNTRVQLHVDPAVFTLETPPGTISLVFNYRTTPGARRNRRTCQSFDSIAND